MDIDMHYYGTYALARAAGLRRDVALRLATAAEFVDDSTETDVIVHPDGARFRGEATAHHPTELGAINDADDQQQVWVPFHFLPGNVGESQSQKLICRKDSQLAKAMVQHHLDLADKPYAVALMGITAHVYADTFAHYGFSGVSSRVNRIRGGTLAPLNADPLFNTAVTRFFEKHGPQGGLFRNFRNKIASLVGEQLSGALGHGAVATFPDQPYLEWRYDYELPELVGAAPLVERQNANDFEEGAAALHGLFRAFAARRPLFADATGGLDFEAIRSQVRALVRMSAGTEERTAAWKAAMATGRLSRSGGEPIPDYSHDEWRRQTQQLATLETPQMASAMPAYHFHQAAAVHRYYVLRELLPSHGIYII